jgi:hypothetical protein
VDTLIKSIVSVITLISGVLALGKGGLDLLKEYRENQSNNFQPGGNENDYRRT